MSCPCKHLFKGRYQPPGSGQAPNQTDPIQVMYGSDWPVAEGRGKCISLGDSFIWLTPDNIDLFARYSKDNIVAPALIGFETLRALKQACDECDRPPRDSRT
jgi:hypothetical protein